MKHGDLRHTVTFQRPINTQDSTGQAIPTWQNVATVKASIAQLSARERFTVALIEASATTRIRTRYTASLASIDASWRILFGIRIFELVAVPNNVRERNREFELLCVEYPER